MADRTQGLRGARDMLLHLTLFWVLVAVAIQFGFPTASRMWVVIPLFFTVMCLFFGEIVLRFVPHK